MTFPVEIKGKRVIKWFYLNVADQNKITKITRLSLAQRGTTTVHGTTALLENPLTGTTVLLHPAELCSHELTMTCACHKLTIFQRLYS